MACSATTLYGPTEAPLVDSMERADGEGRAVEHTFSRRRSFRQRVKRFGQV